MITIINKESNNKKVVTLGAYKDFYEPLGYVLFEEKPLVKEVEIKEKEEVNNVEDKEDIEEEIKENVPYLKGDYRKRSRK